MRLLKVTVLLMGLLPLTINSALAEKKPTLQRKILMDHPVMLPSNRANSKVIRVSFPIGFKTPRHTHDGPGPRYVVKGVLEVVEGGKTSVYSEGEVFWESGQSMTVKNVGGKPAELIIFEIAPAPGDDGNVSLK